MAIILSGDFHGNECHEMTAINTKTMKSFCSAKSVNYDDIKYHIILGDVGILFPNSWKEDMYNIEFFNSKPFITLGVLGNHENYSAIEQLPLVDIGIGNPVWKVSEKLYYMPRGKIYNIDGKKCLVLGGALSLDKEFRTEFVSWWKKEEWGYLETEDLLTLLKTENEFDYVFSHSAPVEAGKYLSKFKGYNGLPIDITNGFDTTVKLNSAVYSMIKFKHWFFGHYHVRFTEDEFSCLYKNLEII
jgi:hypothetical protein